MAGKRLKEYTHPRTSLRRLSDFAEPYDKEKSAFLQSQMLRETILCFHKIIQRILKGFIVL